MQTLITLTPAAAKHIKMMLDKEPLAMSFRLSIKKTGCSGYAYVPKLTNNVLETDIYVAGQYDVPLYVDSAYETFLKGTVIDYVSDEEGLGIKQKRLVFMNPNEKNRCGCGESFTMK